jgi:hypothetical protein
LPLVSLLNQASLLTDFTELIIVNTMLAPILIFVCCRLARLFCRLRELLLLLLLLLLLELEESEFFTSFFCLSIFQLDLT